jgi:NAD(P)-dependent dehydrogenase (short-subunit alcohol dehydrogenase family)
MGRACAERLLRQDASVVAVDLDVPDIDGAVGIACDISDPRSVNRLVDEVRPQGEFRSLVHPSGISPTMADVRRVFEVDLLGTQLLLDAFTPLVEEGTAAIRRGYERGVLRWRARRGGV